MPQRTKPPFRADHVGSLLRPAALREAREKHAAGKIDSDEFKRRIDQAGKFADLDQLCLSGQCGFASTEEGNTLTEDEQWAKLSRIVEVADEVWG